jgi:uncharacterized DUF497 family protein
MRDDEFEWDDAKAARNEAKHGVSFEMAQDAFMDPFAIGWIDDTEMYDEERYCLLGIVNNRIVFVAYTYRSGITRIISARGARPHEQRRYHEDNAE